MLQSKQGKMPWNLFRSEEKKQLTVDPEEAVSTRIGTAEYFIANTVFCRIEALMRNNWNQSLLTDDRDATQWRASFCIKPQSVIKREPLPGNRDKPVLCKTPQIVFNCGSVVVLILYSMDTIYKLWHTIHTNSDLFEMACVMQAVGLEWSHFRLNKTFSSIS